MENNFKFHLIPLLIIIFAFFSSVCSEKKHISVNKNNSKTAVKSASKWFNEKAAKTMKNTVNQQASTPEALINEAVIYSKNPDEIEKFLNCFDFSIIAQNKFNTVWNNLSDEEKAISKNIYKKIVAKNMSYALPTNSSYELIVIQKNNNEASLLMKIKTNNIYLSNKIDLNNINNLWKIISWQQITE